MHLILIPIIKGSSPLLRPRHATLPKDAQLYLHGTSNNSFPLLICMLARCVPKRLFNYCNLLCILITAKHSFKGLSPSASIVICLEISIRFYTIILCNCYRSENSQTKSVGLLDQPLNKSKDRLGLCSSCKTETVKVFSSSKEKTLSHNKIPQ